MSETLTPTQTLLIWGLLARQGFARQMDIMPAPTAADRKALEAAKFLTVTKVSRALVLTLQDKGWGWAADHLRAPLPPAHGTLHAVMVRLHDHLAAADESLADFIGTPPAVAQTTAPITRWNKKTTEAKGGKTAARRKTPAKPKPLSPTALRKRIEAGYLALTGNRKDQGVRLSRLRAELTDLDRATVDAGLARILKGDKKASLLRHDDPRQLGQADHDAAFDPAGEPYHVIWIAS